MNRVRKSLSMIVATVALVAASTTVAAPAQAATWKDVDNNCHNGGVSGSTKYLWCWSKKKRINDNTPNYDVFSYHMSISGEALTGKLNRLWVEMEPRSTSPKQTWFTTDPRRPNQTTEGNSNCKNWSWTIGVSAGVTAAYSESGTICSAKIVYEPVNRSKVGHHAGHFWKSDCWGAGVTKRVTAAVIVRVDPNKVPLWDSSKHGMDKRTGSGQCKGY